MTAVSVYTNYEGSPGDEDAFGHSDYAEALSEVLMSVRPPFTLGLFGDWGIGKTRIIDEIKGRLAKHNCGVVVFDA